jgi:hypothetical protein
MMSWSTLSRFAACSIPVLVLFACSSASSDRSSSGGYAGVGYPQGGEDGGAPSAHPILAPIDTNQTMSAQPGQGVGVFTEYDSGGLWHVWWTCDSAVDQANPPCAFDVKVTAQKGTLDGVTAESFGPGDNYTQASPTTVEATSTVSTQLEGLHFQTEPGATIMLDATVGGQHDGRFLFFVEGGKVDDGFTGTVTDPIQLVGSSP